MNKYLIISIMLLLADCNVQAQQNRKYTIMRSENTNFLLISNSEIPDRIDLPKDEQGKEMSWEDINPRINKISWIVDSIFSDEEVTKLKEYKIWVHFIISSNGKISEVSYQTPVLDAEIDLNKIGILADVLKKEVIFELKFPRTIKTDGSVLYSISLYRIIPFIPGRFKGYER